MLDRVILALAALIFVAGFVRIHLRVQTTVIGYRIGALKDSETKLLEVRSQLQMELAKMTTKENLTKIVKGKSRTHF
jgi:hypothetical protein